MENINLVLAEKRKKNLNNSKYLNNVYTINNHFVSYKYQLLRLIHVSMYFITQLMILQYMKFRVLYKSNITYSCVPMNHI